MGTYFRTARGQVWTHAGLVIDVATLQHSAAMDRATELVEVAEREAATLLLKSGAPRIPVGVIGPNDASASELAQAEAVGRLLATVGFPMVCGGRGGCMEAASRAHSQSGGLVIGILPSSDWREKNAYVSVPVASGIGEARNAIIACACFALIAVGGGHGTLSEMALGLKLGRLVIAMPGAPNVPQAMPCPDADCAVDAVARRYLEGAS